MDPLASFVSRRSRITVGAFSVALLLSLPAVGTEARITTPFTPSSSIELAPGVTYTQGTLRTDGGLIQSVRVATVEPASGSVRVRSLLSNDLVVGRELPSRLTIRKSGPGLVPMVATNGDMSERDRLDGHAVPLSMHVSGGELMVAQPCTRPTLGVDRSGQARIGYVRVRTTLTPVGTRKTRIIQRVNAPRVADRTALYTRRFAGSTQTPSGGVEVVLRLEDTLRPNASQIVTVLAVRRGEGDTPLEAGKAVLSVSAAGKDWVGQLRVGDRHVLQTSVVRYVNDRCDGTIEPAPGWEDIVEAVGGNYFTARNGVVAAPSRALYAPGSERHPRTNVGVTADGRILMVTVDGRQPGYSIGMTLAEMGRLMLSLGARQAFNMDGGGSTVMARHFLSDGRFAVTNRPSDGRERLATQALAVYQVTTTP
jgi:hypothetical protein